MCRITREISRPDVRGVGSINGQRVLRPGLMVCALFFNTHQSSFEVELSIHNCQHRDLLHFYAKPRQNASTMSPSEFTPPSSPDIACDFSLHLDIHTSPQSDYSNRGSPTSSPPCHDDDISDSLSQDRPLVPTSSADWEAKKDVIMELYMTQNLILNDVIQIMLSEHKFKAT